MELLIDSDNEYMYMIEIKVEITQSKTVLAELSDSLPSIKLCGNFKSSKYVKPHILHHFHCEFTKDYIMCHTTSLDIFDKKTSNLLSWKRKTYINENLNTEDAPDATYPYMLKSMQNINPIQTIAVEDYEKNWITHLQCKNGKYFAKLNTFELNDQIRVTADIPTSVSKPYDFTLEFQNNPWDSVNPTVISIDSDDWIDILTHKNSQPSTLKKIIYAVIIVLFLSTLIILIFVVSNIVLKKRRQPSIITDGTFDNESDGVYEENYQRIQQQSNGNNTNGGESVYSNISQILEKAQNRRMENQNTDARRQRRKLLREKSRMMGTGASDQQDKYQQDDGKD